MKALRLLGLPWMAWSTRTRRAVAWVLLVIVAIAAAGYTLRDTPDVGLTHLLNGLAILNGFFWAIVMPRNLGWAREAHRMRLPALGHHSVASTALYAVLTIALPAAALTLAGIPGIIALTEMALGAGFGLGYTALPFWLAYMTCMYPLILRPVRDWLRFPDAHPTVFLHWVVPGTVVLWVLIAIWWRLGIRMDGRTPRWLQQQSMRAEARTMRIFYGSRNPVTALGLFRNSLVRPTVDAELRHTGPSHPVRSLLVILGGWSMPQIWASRLRGAVVALALVSFCAILLVAAQSALFDAFGLHSFVAQPMLHLLQAAALSLGMIGGALGVMRVIPLQLLWSRINGELAVLALLPGLGDAAQAKRSLLQASLLPVLCVQAALLASMFVIGAWLHLSLDNFACLLFAQGTAMLTTVSLPLVTLSGFAVRNRWHRALPGLSMLFVIAMTAYGLNFFGHFSSAQQIDIAFAAAALWAGLITGLVTVARNGWRAYQQRPIPSSPISHEHIPALRRLVGNTARPAVAHLACFAALADGGADGG